MAPYGTHKNLSMKEFIDDLVRKGVYFEGDSLEGKINTWCEYCSDEFFQTNHGFEDVLLVTNASGVVLKEWLASRN